MEHSQVKNARYVVKAEQWPDIGVEWFVWDTRTKQAMNIDPTNPNVTERYRTLVKSKAVEACAKLNL